MNYIGIFNRVVIKDFLLQIYHSRQIKSRLAIRTSFKDYFQAKKKWLIHMEMIISFKQELICFILHMLSISVKNSLQRLTNNLKKLNLELVEEYLSLVNKIKHQKYLDIHDLDEYIHVEPYMIDKSYWGRRSYLFSQTEELELIKLDK